MVDAINLTDGANGSGTSYNYSTNCFDDSIGSNSANSSGFTSSVSSGSSDSDKWYAPYIQDNPSWQSLIKQGEASGVDYTQGEPRKMLEQLFGLRTPSSSSASSTPDLDWQWNVTDKDTNNEHYNNFYNHFKSLIDKYLASQQEYNQGSADRAMDFEAEQARINRDWQEMMDNTRYQRAVEDMRKAGINPLLGFFNGSGAASTPSGATASGHSAGSSMPNASQLLTAMVALMSFKSGDFWKIEDLLMDIASLFKFW